jgi:hypothetical protein
MFFTLQFRFNFTLHVIMNMYVMLMIILWDVNACSTPRGVTLLSIASEPRSFVLLLNRTV